MSLRLALAGVIAALPAGLFAQSSPPPPPPPPSPSPPLSPPAARDTSLKADTTRRPGNIAIPGLDLPIQLDLTILTKSERDRNLRCNSLEAFQVSALSGCSANFLFPTPDFRFALKSAGTVGDQLHVNVDYDAQREFDASNTVSMYYQGKPGATLQRVDVGNISFSPPPSRFLTSSLPSGNYGMQASIQLGRLNLKPIIAFQTGNVVQVQHIAMGSRAKQLSDRDIADYQLEARRFFFTIDPLLFGKAYPNVDILNAAQLRSLGAALPDSVRPTRVLVYRLQFGTQPQNPSGPQFRLQGQVAHQTYDLLREGVDYFMDPSLLWFALARPLNPTNERLVVAYNVRVNGRDTVIASTGGTPDLQVTTAHDQVANLIMDPNVGPSSPQFRNEIRSVYRLAGPELVRASTQLRVVAGNGLLEHPIAGTAATFLQMLGLAQSSNTAEFDYDNRIWPRVSDPVLDLGAGAVDLRSGASLNSTHVIRDYFIVMPSLQPFAQQDSGLVTPGNPTNAAIYTTPDDYLNSPQHPASVYRLHVHYQTAATDEQPGVITLGATQMRPGSEEVLVDGRPLVRDLDYRVDYDLARIEFMRPDTLFALDRDVAVRYEENPTSFLATRTTLGGLVAELPVSHGTFDFTAIQQSQSTSFTQPQLGFQQNSMLTAGVTGQFNWNAPLLTRLASFLPSSDGKTLSHVSVQGEFASSRPQFGSANQGQAYVETFEDGSNGLTVSLGDAAWRKGSLPAYGSSLRSSMFAPSLFEINHAGTVVWQTYVQTLGGTQIKFTRSQIDPLTVLNGIGAQPNEPVMWVTLLPLDERGRFDRAKRGYDWTASNQPTGQRWGSIQTPLSPTGVDLTGEELLEFWTLADTSIAERKKNPILVLDFGDVSENSLATAPETLTVRHNSDGSVDSLFTGVKLQGFDVLNTERDPFSHTFNAAVNDNGLPGDVVDTLVVIDGMTVKKVLNAKICRGAVSSLDVLGDPHTNCTISNSRLDEEDIDLDNTLNFTNAQRESERLLRYVVDLSDPAKYKRVGGKYTDTLLVRGVPEVRTREWVLVSIPFKTPTDSLNDVNRRRIRALRLTVVSGSAQDDEEATQFPIAELHVTGAPWLNRSDVPLGGIAGIATIAANGGFMITSTIGTTDSSTAVIYQPPPGVTNQASTQAAQFSGSVTQINEQSMRIQAGNMSLYHRAEAYYRFPSGPQDFFGFQQLRVWGRGRGDGWGTNGDLQMYIKVGRDENNFYLYRAPMMAGQTPAAWTDLQIDFSRFVALRQQLQTQYLAGKKESIQCSGADSAMIVASPLPVGVVSHRFAACDSGYMVYTVDPAVAAPSLTAVQEIAVGFVRIAATSGLGSVPISSGDTLELWVDDVRLDHPQNKAGFAGQATMNANFGDLGDLHVTIANKDPNFRQIGEQATFLGERDVDISGTFRLDKLLPAGAGVALPLSITKVSSASNPAYLTQTDISTSGIPGVRKPRDDLTTYSLTARRSTPMDIRGIGPLVNNLSATMSYTSGVDRTEYQDGNAHNFTGTLDYLVAGDSARALGLPSWMDATLGSLPSVLQEGPVAALRQTQFRWNPTQFRLTTGVINATDHRESYILPAGAPNDPPSISDAKSRLWRNGAVLEFRPTTNFIAHWDVQSTRDLRNYGDSTVATTIASRQREDFLGADAGFERDRSMTTSLTFTPSFSAWFRPRGELATQFEMLRDPNSPSLVQLPGVVGVDSVLASRDSIAMASSFTLPRRMTSAQTASVGTQIDVARAVSAYVRDSGWVRYVGAMVTPIDIAYTRSLLSALDASPVGAPLLYQLGLGGPGAFRYVNGVDATAAGETGTVTASSSVLLPLGTSLAGRYRRTTTLNWIDRPDTSEAQVNGAQTQFPDATLRWRYQPAVIDGPLATVDASVGFVRSDVTVSLPSEIDEAPPEIRHTHIETFPVGGSVVWAGRGSLSTGARFSVTHRIDSLPGSVARSLGNEVSLDVSRAFRIPQSWGLSLKNDLRARANFQLSHTTTFAYDSTGALQSRLQDNGRQAFNLTADTNVQDNTVLTFQGSRIVTFDNNLNRRFEQIVLSVALQMQIFGGGK
ncbi:MAG TPA: cell surface protein SprA [Gemmatimonadaceae bacterium]|nr:cell surface protein SprA [Gemmatimonadaceae bacterium]